MSQFGNKLMDRFGRTAPLWAVQAAGHALFWPIACSQYLMARAGLLQWYNEVYASDNGKVFMGGIPWPEQIRKDLIDQAKVSCVVNLVSERKIDFPVQCRLDVPMTDFVHPTIEQIVPAVDFLDQCLSEGRNVYVHCRAGKGRSATVVMCWLVSRAGMTPMQAQKYLQAKRPQIVEDLWKRDAVQEMYKRRKVL